MARKWLIGAGIAVVAVGLVVGGAAYAASSAAAPGLAREVAAFAMGPMMQSGPGGPTGEDAPLAGVRGRLHEYMVQEVAAGLSLETEDLQARLDGGETLVSIAQAQGIETEDLPALLKDAWARALAAAVADGVLTQEQADWMAAHPLLLRAAGARMHGLRGARQPRGPMGRGFFGQPWLEPSDGTDQAEGTTNG